MGEERSPSEDRRAEHRSQVFPFRVVDGERLVAFGEGVAGDAPELLAGRGFGGYALLTTSRAAAQAPAVAEGADVVLDVPSGPVPDIAAAVRAEVGGRPIVALGGGRVVDAGKAIGAADRLAVAAIPTTLAGSAITGIHRLPAGVESAKLIRPSLVVADPELSASAPRDQLLATAMNALAHALESLYAWGANPVAEGAALRAAALLGAALPLDPVPKPQAALGGLLGGWAAGMTGISFHHAICQSLVRAFGLSHAETNALMLPRTGALAAELHPEKVEPFLAALGRPITELAGVNAERSLADLGMPADGVDDAVAAIQQHPVWQASGVTEEQLRDLLATRSP